MEQEEPNQAETDEERWKWLAYSLKASLDGLPGSTFRPQHKPVPNQDFGEALAQVARSMEQAYKPHHPLISLVFDDAEYAGVKMNEESRYWARVALSGCHRFAVSHIPGPMSDMPISFPFPPKLTKEFLLKYWWPDRGLAEYCFDYALGVVSGRYF